MEMGGSNPALLPMFGSLLRAVENVATVALAPVAVAAVLVEAATKPLADGANALTQTAREAVGAYKDRE